jgi:hypothetical protein
MELNAAMTDDFRHLLELARALRLAQKGNLVLGIKPDSTDAKRLEAALDHFIRSMIGQGRENEAMSKPALKKKRPRPKSKRKLSATQIIRTAAAVQKPAVGRPRMWSNVSIRRRSRRSQTKK